MMTNEVDKMNNLKKIRELYGATQEEVASANLMRQYEDVYEGKSINIEAQIKTAETREGNPVF